MTPQSYGGLVVWKNLDSTYKAFIFMHFKLYEQTLQNLWNDNLPPINRNIYI
jgi:hypothetical protein